MNLRKSIYFKPLCLLVAALFTGQCISYERKLISTEAKVIENGNHGYVYEFEKIKIPSSQDPTVEYKIVKFPANKVETINIYKRRKVDGSLPIFIGALAGTFLGNGAGSNATPHEYGKYVSSLVGFLVGVTLGSHFLKKIMSEKSDLKGVIKEHAGAYLQKKADSFPIPAPNFPLEFRWWPYGKNISFKTQTNEQGIVRINLIDDLKMTKFLLARPLILYIYYLNPESQIKEIFKDSFGPGK